MWGQGMQLPQCRQAWPQFSPRAGKGGCFQKGISPLLPHCRWHLPIPSSAVAHEKAVWHGGDAVAGEECVNPARCCPGRHLGRPLGPGLPLARGSVGSLAALSLPALLLTCVCRSSAWPSAAFPFCVCRTALVVAPSELLPQRGRADLRADQCFS